MRKSYPNVKPAIETLPPVFTEMLRSFVSLGLTLNLSAAVKELNTTRQTIRRHISELERLKGGALFEMVDRHYALTDLGQQMLRPSIDLLSQSADWLGDENRISAIYLSKASVLVDEDHYAYVQQHPLNRIWVDGTPLIKRGLLNWTEAGGQLEHDKLTAIRPYLLVCREHRGEWLTAEIGEKSSYATWIGWELSKSGVGRSFFQDDAHTKIDAYLLNAYQKVLETGGLWYDHVVAKINRVADSGSAPVNYQRLVAACTYPNGDPAVMVLVARTDKVSVPFCPADKIYPTSEEDLMEFEI